MGKDLHSNFAPHFELQLKFIFECGFQIIVVLREVELPPPLTDLPAIRIEQHDWWTHLLARLALPGQSMVLHVCVGGSVVFKV